MANSYNREAALQSAEQLVRTKMASYDPSHDALHVWRVRRMALKISQTEMNLYGKTIDTDVVELAALFHDLQDHKYTTSNNNENGQRKNSSHQTSNSEMMDIMLDGGLDQERADLVMRIIQNTSYSTEKKLRTAGQWGDWHQSCLELHCVQDADRLDAIGTFGLFRASAYSGAIDKPLYAFENDAINCARTAEDLPANSKYGDSGNGRSNTYESRDTQDWYSTYKHFHDKLLLLKDCMKTETGKIVGARRHEYMAAAIDALDTEFDLADFPQSV